MAVTTDAYTASDLAAIIPEMWTPRVLEQFFAKTVFANFCMDASVYGAGHDIVHIPGVYTNAFTVQTQSTQGAEVTTESVAMDDTQLTINTHKYIAILIGDKDLQQIMTNVDALAVWAQKMGASLADALEDSLAALWSDLSTNSVGDTATVLSDAEVRQSVEKLDTLNVPLDECAWFVHPYVYWNQLHAVAKYYTQSTVGPQNVLGPVATGNFAGNTSMERSLRGVLYGIPIYTTSNIVGALQTYRNLLIHKTTFAFAVQTRGAGMIRTQVSNEVRNLGTLMVSDILYGVKTVREATGVLVNASSAFIGS